MGTFLKYLFYLLLLVVIFLVAKGIYDGNIDRETTVGEVVSQVEDGTQEMAKDAGNAVDKAVDKYRSSPKKDIELD